MKDRLKSGEVSERQATASFNGEWQAAQYINKITPRKKLPPTEEIISNLHKKIMTPLVTPEAVANLGEYRTHDIWFASAGIEPPTWREIPGIMEEFGKDMDIRIKNSKCGAPYIGEFIDTLARTHYAMVATQPFFDGNKRTARHFTSFLCKRLKFQPVVIGPVHKNTYLDAIDKSAQAGNTDHLGLFFSTLLWQNYTSDTCEDEIYRIFITDKIKRLNRSLIRQ